MKRESSQTCSLASVAVRVYTGSRNGKPRWRAGLGHLVLAASLAHSDHRMECALMQGLSREKLIDVKAVPEVNRLRQMSISELADQVCLLNRQLIEKCFAQPDGVSLSEYRQRMGLEP